jgi:hypothetical protein
MRLTLEAFPVCGENSVLSGIFSLPYMWGDRQFFMRYSCWFGGQVSSLLQSQIHGKSVQKSMAFESAFFESRDNHRPSPAVQKT